MPQTLYLLPLKLALVRYPPNVEFRVHAGGGFFAQVSTPNEVSFVTVQENIPKDAYKVSKGWRLFEVAGPFQLNAIGVLASIAAPLAEAKVSIFALSSWDTDFILVQYRQVARACKALRAAGHKVVEKK